MQPLKCRERWEKGTNSGMWLIAILLVRANTHNWLKSQCWVMCANRWDGWIKCHIQMQCMQLCVSLNLTFHVISYFLIKEASNLGWCCSYCTGVAAVGHSILCVRIEFHYSEIWTAWFLMGVYSTFIIVVVVWKSSAIRHSRTLNLFFRYSFFLTVSGAEQKCFHSVGDCLWLDQQQQRQQWRRYERKNARRVSVCPSIDTRIK